MQLISCDPASKKSAFAIFYKGKLIDTDKLKMTINDLKEYLSQFNNFGLAIETQYGSENTKTLIKLVEARMKIEMLALHAGCEYIYNINPATWQKCLSRKKMLRDERKRLSLELASDIAGREIKDNDIADAICLGKYVLNNYEDLAIKEIL